MDIRSYHKGIYMPLVQAKESAEVASSYDVLVGSLFDKCVRCVGQHLKKWVTQVLDPSVPQSVMVGY